MVRCKFKVNSITRSEGTRPNAEGKYEKCIMSTISASPTYSTDPNSENKKFWDASPGGKFELNCVNEAAVAQLEIGKEYYIDISPADAPA